MHIAKLVFTYQNWGFTLDYSYVKLPQGNRDIVGQNQPTISNMVDCYGVAEFVDGLCWVYNGLLWDYNGV